MRVCDVVDLYPCGLDVMLYILPAIFIVLNSYGMFRMCQSYKKLKFENYVLLSGLIESILFILAKSLELDILKELVEFLQIIIILFVARRFLKIYLILNQKKANTKIYNYFFVILVIVNTFFVIILLGLEAYCYFANENHTSRKDYIAESHHIFSFLISLILTIFGLNVKKMITLSLEDSSRSYPVLHSNSTLSRNVPDESHEIIQESLHNPVERENLEREIYFSTRRAQINILIFTFLICDLMELICETIILTALHANFNNDNKYYSYPTNLAAAILLLLEDLGNLLPIFFKFLAFYFIVRDSYLIESKIFKKNESYNQRDINRYSAENSMKEVDKFLNS